LYSEAVKRHIQLYPVYTPEEIAKDKHLHARQFWVKVEHEELGTALTYPGAFAKLSETPCRIWRRAPLIGEHNEEIYQRELNLSQEELSALKQAGII
jgi:crotonobetainyl-CoA:carnitine CoA-transferase CaiB-like acyl-CoA transferase